MPTYQYECEACGHQFEELQSMTDKKLKKCPKCAKMTLVRHIGSGSGIIFKGTGFYETDYKKKGTDSSPAPAAAASPAASAGHAHAGGCCGGSAAPAPAPKSSAKKSSRS